MIVNLDDYIFPVIEYDPTENPRGIVTADEWNTIMNLLKASANYTSKALQEVFSDLYTAHELSSTTLGQDGSRLIGVDVIPGVTGRDVNAVLRDLKNQLDAVTLGSIPDGSITSEKLAPNLDFTGEEVTLNNVKLLSVNDISIDFSENSTNEQVAGAAAVYYALAEKQNNITTGTAEPTADTPGTIYLQYIV